MPKQRKKSPVEEPSYEVECINAARVVAGGQWIYNIKWGGYPETENSWEPESNLGGCARMMADFWQQVGAEHKPRAKLYPVNHEVRPSAMWIKRQRDSYRKAKEKEARKTKSTKNNDSNRRIISSSSGSSSDGENSEQQSFERSGNDSDDVPLSSIVKRTSDYIAVPATAPNSEEPRTSSKHKLDNDLASDFLNKRIRLTETEMSDETTSKKDEPDISRGSSPSDSLFGGGSDTSVEAQLSTPVSRQAPAQPPSTQSSIPPEAKIKEKSKVPLHVQRRQNPLVKPLALPRLDTSFGGIPTKARILSQSNAKATLPGSARTPTSGSQSPATYSPDIPQPAVAKLESDANAWLKENIMTKEELVRAQSSAEPTSVPQTVHQLPRFSKRWRWTGQLAIGDNETGFAEPVGSVVITDNTPLDLNVAKLSIEALLPSNVGTICLRHYHTLALLRTVLCDYRLSQFAFMTASQSEHENHFQDVVLYMKKNELFSHSSLTVSDIEAATLFVLPSDSLHILDSLNVPAKVRQDGGLIVAIGFKVYVPPRRTLGGSPTIYTEDWKDTLDVDSFYHMRSTEFDRALSSLNFPEDLLQRFNNKQCTIFTTPSDRELPGHDTMALVSILEGAPGCTIVSAATGNARYIFIHVSSWSILHKLPGLVDRRLRRPDIQFYTYGSDPSVDRDKWGVHEVFPLGGIVTFTPRAIVEDPIAVERLIDQLDKHTLWTCYVLPSVIPMICKVAAEKGTDSEEKIDDALCSILLPMAKGQIDLTWQLPNRMTHDANSEPKWLEWLSDQSRLSSLHANELVAECKRRFKQQQQGFSEKDVETQIYRDLLAMQSDLRAEYRRFVIITDTSSPSNTSKEAAASSSSSKADIKDGFELTHVRDFTFNDDFFVADGV